MASTSEVSMTMPLTYANQKRVVVPTSEAFFKPLPLRPSKAVVASKPNGRFQVRASSMKEKVVTGLTAAALTASMTVPDVAEAAAVPPSLKNFLLESLLEPWLVYPISIRSSEADEHSYMVPSFSLRAASRVRCTAYHVPDSL